MHQTNVLKIIKRTANCRGPGPGPTTSEPKIEASDLKVSTPNEFIDIRAKARRSRAMCCTPTPNPRLGQVYTGSRLTSTHSCITHLVSGEFPILPVRRGPSLFDGLSLLKFRELIYGNGLSRCPLLLRPLPPHPPPPIPSTPSASTAPRQAAPRLP
jgi:hypothetical protein